MAKSVGADDTRRPLLPPPPHHGAPLPVTPLPHRRRFIHLLLRLRRCQSLLASLALALATLPAALYLLWPSDPDLGVARLHLERVHLSISPVVYLNVSMSLAVKVRNPNFFSLDYESLVASIGYRGRRLGSVTSDGGRVRARGVSNVDAELQLDGIRVIHDMFYLIEDYRRGSIPFDTITEVQGQLFLFFIDIPVQGNFSCSVQVDPQNQTLLRQDCYIE